MLAAILYIDVVSILMSSLYSEIMYIRPPLFGYNTRECPVFHSVYIGMSSVVIIGKAELRISPRPQTSTATLWCIVVALHVLNYQCSVSAMQPEISPYITNNIGRDKDGVFHTDVVRVYCVSCHGRRVVFSC